MKKTIVCFGDSNTHGYCSATGGRFDEETRWPGVLQTLLGAEYAVREEGLSGRTTVFEDPLFEGLNGLTAIYPCLMTHEPVELLIIMLGTNDTKERFGCNAENIAKGLKRLVEKAKASKEAWRNGTPKVLLIAPPPIGVGYLQSPVTGEMGQSCVEKSEQLAAEFRKVAEETGCFFLDAGALGLVMHPADHMHLGADSHRKLAEELARQIQELESGMESGMEEVAK